MWPWASSSLVQPSGISFVSSWGGIDRIPGLTLDSAQTVISAVGYGAGPQGAYCLGGTSRKHMACEEDTYHVRLPF